VLRPAGFSSTHQIARRLLAGPRVAIQTNLRQDRPGQFFRVNWSSRFSEGACRTVLKTHKRRLNQNSGSVKITSDPDTFINGLDCGL
jgi:hypothetical protein